MLRLHDGGMTFTHAELAYLADQELARMATTGPNGPQVDRKSVV